MKRLRSVPAAMPGLMNDKGSGQAEADLCAIKHPIFPPSSASGEMTGQAMIGDRLLCQLAPEVKIRWRAYRIERVCQWDEWEFSSETALLLGEAGVMVRWRVKNLVKTRRKLPFGLMGREPRLRCRMAGLAALCLRHNTARGQHARRQMVWTAPFTPGSKHFSGHMPVLETSTRRSPNDSKEPRRSISSSTMAGPSGLMEASSRTATGSSTANPFPMVSQRPAKRILRGLFLQA